MAQKSIPLYPSTIPNSIPGADEEQLLYKDIAMYSHVSKPTLTIYLPEKNKSNGTGIIICPGGGYSIVAFQHEGDDVAKEFVKAGVAAFVLKYRIPDDKIMKDKTIGPLQDAQQSIKLVRQRAKEWNLNQNKIGILGFSAGGHLASTAGTHFNSAVIGNKEAINLRPDFMILIYPVISFTDSIGHLGSRENLLGKSPSLEMIKLYSNEFQVTQKTPPTFLEHATDDDVVKVANSLIFCAALKKNNVPCEIKIDKEGGHGFGLINKKVSEQWMAQCIAWMKKNEWL